MTLRRHQLAALAAVTLALTAARVAPAAPTKPAPAPAPAPTAAPRTEADGSTDVATYLQAMEREVPKRLEPEFVVAEVQEPSTEALVTRAAMFPGGGQYNTETPRAALIRFLISAQHIINDDVRSETGNEHEAVEHGKRGRA